MTTPTDTPSPRITRDKIKAPLNETTDSVASGKYFRLEDLLRQTLALVGDIADAKGHDRRTAAGSTSPTTPHLLSSDECILLRKDSAVDHPFFPRYRSYSSSSSLASPNLANTTRRSRFASGEDSFDVDTSSAPSPSASLPVQEPFSPGILALSLDAVVEQKRSGQNNNTESFCLDPSSSITSLDNSGGSATATSVTTVGRVPNLTTITASSSWQPPTPSTSPENLPSPSSACGLWNLRSLPSHRRKSSRESTCCEEHQSTASSASARWHVRILPISSLATGALAPVAGRCEAADSLPSSTPLPATPAYVKLEAMIPYRFASDSTLATSGLSEDGSYIIIWRPPPDSYGDGRPECLPGSSGEGLHQLKGAPGRSLQDFIHDYEYPTGPLG